jgi:hypothetical protein
MTTATATPAAKICVSNNTSQRILVTAATMAVVAAAGYFFGFHMLFAHAAIEVFYYAGLFAAAYLAGEGINSMINNIRTVSA